MEKITKTYVNCLLWGRDWVRYEVDHRDPEKVDTKNGDITQFRFFEVSYIVDGEDIYVGKNKNFSPIYHVGKRISFAEALALADTERSKSYFLSLLEKHQGTVSLCKTELGYVEEIQENDMTLEEYIESKKKTRK